MLGLVLLLQLHVPQTQYIHVPKGTKANGVPLEIHEKAPRVVEVQRSDGTVLENLTDTLNRMLREEAAKQNLDSLFTQAYSKKSLVTFQSESSPHWQWSVSSPNGRMYLRCPKHGSLSHRVKIGSSDYFWHEALTITDEAGKTYRPLCIRCLTEAAKSKRFRLRRVTVSLDE